MTSSDHPHTTPKSASVGLEGSGELSFHEDLTDERHAEINAYLNALGGYQRVFNAIGVAARTEANGLAISPMRFADSMLRAATASPSDASDEGPGTHSKPPPEWDREILAKWVYAAMVWAATEAKGDPDPRWVEGGNSLAQTEARRAANEIIALGGGKP